VQPEQGHLPAVGVPRELQLDPEILSAAPGVWLVREKNGGGALRPALQRGAKIEPPLQGSSTPQKPEAIAPTLEEQAAVAQYPHTGPLELPLDRVGASPEIVVSQAANTPCLAGIERWPPPPAARTAASCARCRR